MLSESIIESFRKLSTEDKFRVLEELWSEVAEECDALPLSEAHRQLLDERLQEHADNPDDAGSWIEVRADVGF